MPDAPPRLGGSPDASSLDDEVHGSDAAVDLLDPDDPADPADPADPERDDVDLSLVPTESGSILDDVTIVPKPEREFGPPGRTPWHHRLGVGPIDPETFYRRQATALLAVVCLLLAILGLGRAGVWERLTTDGSPTFRSTDARPTADGGVSESRREEDLTGSGRHMSFADRLGQAASEAAGQRPPAAPARSNRTKEPLRAAADAAPSSAEATAGLASELIAEAAGIAPLEPAVDEQDPTQTAPPTDDGELNPNEPNNPPPTPIDDPTTTTTEPIVDTSAPTVTEAPTTIEVPTTTTQTAATPLTTTTEESPEPQTPTIDPAPTPLPLPPPTPAPPTSATDEWLPGELQRHEFDHNDTLA